MRGDSHGDHPPETHSPPKSTIPANNHTKSTTDQDAPGDDLQIHPTFVAEEPRRTEIESCQEQARYQGPVEDTGVQELTPAAARHQDEDAPSQDHQARPEDSILPDLAQDLRLQADITLTRPGARLDGPDEDPLVKDLLQRLASREIPQNPPVDVTTAQTPQGTRVMGREMKQSISSEKGKGQVAEARPRQHSIQLAARERSNTTGNWKFQSGECSRVSGAQGRQSSYYQERSKRPSQQECPRRTERHWQPEAQLEEHGFQIVKAPYWWRKIGTHSREDSKHHQPGQEERRKKYREHVKGKCLNCYSTQHRVAHCNYQAKCWRCLKPGHQALSCPSRRNRYKQPSPEQQQHSHTPPRSTQAGQATRTADRSYLQAAKGESTPMAAYPGDPRARSDQAFCAVTATGSIKRRREALVGRSAVCWLNGNSHDTGTHHVVEALEEQLHINRHEVRVVKHFPEQYLVFFSDCRAFNRVLHHRGIRNRGRVFNFEPWSEGRNAVESKLEYRVRLRIEGMPVHAWSEAVAAQVIGQHCAIHFVEEQSRRQERTRTYDLWAWSSNPSKIPKKVLLTVTDPDREQQPIDVPRNLVEMHLDPPRGFKGAYNYKLHIHLDVVEDLSFLHGRGGGGGHYRKPRREFLWNYGAADSLGERRSGQGHDDRTGRDYRPRHDRDDYDDNFQRGVRRHRSNSAWGRMTRCRGTVDDCYSSNRYRDSNHDYTGHRSRVGPPDSSNLTWHKKKGPLKSVTFANPMVQILGESLHLPIQCYTDEALIPQDRAEEAMERSDPMREEMLITHCYAGFPSKERRILDMLEAPGWTPVPSPVGGINTDSSTLSFKPFEVHNPTTELSTASHELCLWDKIIQLENQAQTLESPTQPSPTILEPTEVNTNLTFSTATTSDSPEVATTEPPEHTLQVANTVRVQTQEPSRADASTSTNRSNNSENVLADRETDQVDDMTSFLNFISHVPVAPILHTPPRVNPIQQESHGNIPAPSHRKSSRLADKAKLHSGKDSIQLAQSILISKLGELSPKAPHQDKPDFDNFTQHLPKPLTSMKMAAI
ncbi:uncharacterized protein [Setaria viridis]|uniref:uncharacterized protein n=1 Tax=Setaria viridis TaxID=4556 RepID=UPI003B3A54F2